MTRQEAEAAVEHAQVTLRQRGLAGAVIVVAAPIDGEAKPKLFCSCRSLRPEAAVGVLADVARRHGMGPAAPLAAKARLN